MTTSLRTEIAGGEYMEHRPWSKPIPKGTKTKGCSAEGEPRYEVTGSEKNGPGFTFGARADQVHWVENGKFLPCKYDDCRFLPNAPSTKVAKAPKPKKVKKVRTPKTPAFSKVTVRDAATGEVKRVTAAAKPERKIKEDDSAELTEFIRVRFGWSGEITPRIRQLAREAIAHQAQVLAYIQK